MAEHAAFRTVRNKFLPFTSHPGCGLLLSQLELTKAKGYKHGEKNMS